MALSINIVEHDANKIHGCITFLKPQCDGGSTGGRALRIDDQYGARIP